MEFPCGSLKGFSIIVEAGAPRIDLPGYDDHVSEAGHAVWPLSPTSAYVLLRQQEMGSWISNGRAIRASRKRFGR